MDGVSDIVNLVFVRHEGNGKLYLFRVPVRRLIADGTLVSVRVRGGRKEIGTVDTQSFYVTETLARVIARACGGHWPLAEVVGIYEEEQLC